MPENILRKAGGFVNSITGLTEGHRYLDVNHKLYVFYSGLVINTVGVFVTHRTCKRIAEDNLQQHWTSFCLWYVGGVGV